MRIRDNKKVFIITIVVIVLVVLIGGAYVIFATDMFKSNKDLFFEYAAQIFSENGLIDNKLEQYNAKKNNKTYENEGKVTFTINSANIDKDILENVNKLNISFAGNTDKANKKQESVMKINYNSEVNYPMYYKKANDIEGLKLLDVSKTTYFSVKGGEVGKFIARLIGNKELFKIFSMESLKIDLSNLKLTKDEQKKLKDTYLKNIEQSIDGANITKISKDDLTGYTLEIGNKDLKQLLVNTLETLKNDNLMLNKISKVTGAEIGAEKIQTIKNAIDLIDMENGSTNITLYGKNKELKRIEVKYKDELNILVNKESSDDEEKYHIEFENLKLFASCDIKYTGLKKMENITENYEFNFDFNDDNNVENSYKYNIDNSITFNNDINISDFNEKDYIELNSLSKERLVKLLQTIGKKIEKTSNDGLEKAEIETENPVLYIIPGLRETIFKYIPNKNEQNQNSNSNNNEQNNNSQNNNNQNNNQEQNNNSQNQEQGQEQNQNENQGQQGSSMIEGMERLEKESFNKRIQQYEGQNVKGPTVKSLFMQIIASNMAMEDRQIEVVGDIELNGDQVPDSIVSSKMYTVKCFLGADGYVNKVEVKEKATDASTTTNTTNN